MWNRISLVNMPPRVFATRHKIKGNDRCNQMLEVTLKVGQVFC